MNTKKLCCLTTVNNPRSIRTISETQTSCLNVNLNCYENPRRNRRGGADDNMIVPRHAQSIASAGEDTNGGTYNYTDISTTGTSSIGNYCGYWNKLKGYVPKLVPAEMKTDRNIGVWRYQRDVRLSVHAQSDMNRNIGVRRMYTDTHTHTHTHTGVQHDQQERWGQCNLRYPPNATQIRELKPWRQVQGGVVEPMTSMGRSGLEHHGPGAGCSSRVVCECHQCFKLKVYALFVYMWCCESLLSLHFWIRLLIQKKMRDILMQNPHPVETLLKELV